MIPAFLALTAKQGSTWRLRFILKNHDQSPVNLTGCTAKMQVRVTPAAEVTLDCASYLSIAPDGSDGAVSLNVPYAVMAGVPARQPPFSSTTQPYEWDLDIVSPDGSTKDSWLYGTLAIMAGITR